MHGAKLLVLTSPSNPTGGIIAPEDLELISWWAERLDVLILSDEVFERFAYDEEPTSIATLPRARPRTLTAGSVSKSHALAWARVGWIAGHRHLLRACRASAALRCPFVPTLSQLAALDALRSGQDACDHAHERFDSRRHYVADRLRTFGLKPIWPVAGFFFWVPVPAQWRTGRAFAEALLATHRVRVAPGDLFGPSGTGHVRISFVTDEGRLDEGLNRIGEMVRGEKQRLRLVRKAV
jgi:aminotransferase